MKYIEAKRIADRIIEVLSPYCVLCNIGGSIRREKPEVGDIEIICQAKVIVGGGQGSINHS